MRGRRNGLAQGGLQAQQTSRERNSPPELILCFTHLSAPSAPSSFSSFSSSSSPPPLTLAKKSSHPFKLGLIEESRFLSLSPCQTRTQRRIAKKCAPFMNDRDAKWRRSFRFPVRLAPTPLQTLIDSGDAIDFEPSGDSRCQMLTALQSYFTGKQPASGTMRIPNAKNCSTFSPEFRPIPQDGERR
jgi:hypothetical protein